MKIYLTELGKTVLESETILEKLEDARTPQIESLFDPARFIVPRWDTVLTYSNKTLFYHPEGGRNRIEFVNVQSRPLINSGKWYFVIPALTLFLPLMWLIGRKMFWPSFSKGTLGTIARCLSLAFVLANTRAVRAEDKPQSLVDQFKNYLAHRPEIESVTFSKKFGPYYKWPEEAKALQFYHGRWQSPTLYYLQQLHSQKELGAVAANTTYVGHTNEMAWAISGGRLTLQRIIGPELPPGQARVPQLESILNDALNFSLPRMKASTVIWKGDDFEAEVEGGKMNGHLNVEVGRPKSIDYNGRGKFLDPRERLTVEYNYGPQTKSLVPVTMKLYLNESGKRILKMETTLESLKTASEPQDVTVFDPAQFINPRWDTVLTYSNKTLLYHPQGEPSRVVAVSRRGRLNPASLKTYRTWYYVIVGLVFFLPLIWFAVRKIGNSKR